MFISHVPNQSVRRGNLSFLTLRSTLKPIWWKNTVEKCLHGIKKMRGGFKPTSLSKTWDKVGGMDTVAEGGIESVIEIENENESLHHINSRSRHRARLRRLPPPPLRDHPVLEGGGKGLEQH
jgi:hypothetical protein